MRKKDLLAAAKVVKEEKEKEEHKKKLNKALLAAAAEKVGKMKQEEEDKEKLNKALLVAAAEKAKMKQEQAQKKAEEEAKNKEAVDHKMEIKTYSEADVNECKGFFNMMDKDGNGELSVDDLEVVIDSKVKAHVDKAEIRQFVEDIGKADTNNDEIISKREFMSACLND